VIEGLLGRKLGMVQVFDSEGRMRGATVIETGPCVVTQIRTNDRDGYAAVQLGFGAAKRRNKPMRGHLKQLGDLRYLREFKVDDPSEHKVGERVGVEIFEAGDKVNVTATSKGRGFAGGVKRYGFAGGPKTHGQSDRHRAPGSVGAGNTPGRTFKGHRMAGHMGHEQVTIKRLEVLESNPARGILIVAGSVPGANNSLVKIRFDSRTLDVARKREPKQFAEPAAEAAPAPAETEGAVAETADVTEQAPAAVETAEEAEAAEQTEPATAEAEGAAPEAKAEAEEGPAEEATDAEPEAEAAGESDEEKS